MYWELRCCGGKSHILTIQHRISKIAENSLVKLGIWLPYNSSLSRPMQPCQTYSPGFTNGRTDRKLLQAINPSAAMLRSGLKTSDIHHLTVTSLGTGASITRSRYRFTGQQYTQQETIPEMLMVTFCISWKYINCQLLSTDCVTNIIEF